MCPSKPKHTVLLATAAMLTVVGVLCCPWPGLRSQATELCPVLPERFHGEQLQYTISFMLFRKAATGMLSFSEGGGEYEAVFEARTAGLLRVIVGERTGRLRSRMVYDNATRRFRPVSFQEVFIKGKKERSKTLLFDYDLNKFTVIRKRETYEDLISREK